jgi:peptidase E
MNTIFILHGGKLKDESPKNDSFFREVVRGLQDEDTVLFIGFARRDEQDRNEVFERDKKLILAQTDKRIKVINATYSNLIEQAQNAQAIFITGGETPELVNDMKNYPNFLDAVRGKIIAGSSAGACLFSTYYFFNREKGILPGLGTLPIRLMVHYGNPHYHSTKETLEELKECPGDLELVVLPEHEWRVMEKEL